ncbi:MAG: hypothetical protein V3W41_05915 [Planctomycetota bacterium]
MGFPTLKKVADKFAANDDVVILAIQTVFEGHRVNSFDKLEMLAKRFGLKIPFGHDPGKDGKRSHILDRYQTGGTPWNIVIDGSGRVKFNGFVRSAKPVVEAIEKSLEKKKDGQLLLGTAAPALATGLGVTKRKRPLWDKPLTIVQFFTKDDEAQRKTLVSLEALRKKYKQVEMIVVYPIAKKKTGEGKKIYAKLKKQGLKRHLVLDRDSRILHQMRAQAGNLSDAIPILVVDELQQIVWARDKADLFSSMGKSKTPEAKKSAGTSALQGLNRWIAEYLK